VAVARPHYLDLEATPVSEGVKRIVDYINAHSGCTRRQLIEALAPSVPRAVAPATPAEGAVVSEPVAPVPVPSSAPAPPSGDLQEPTTEQTVVIADLHWLIHQGHVIEFANGRIETARKPIPKPPRPAPKPAEVAAQPAASGDETAPTPEATENAAPAAEPDVMAQGNPPNLETTLPAMPEDTTDSPTIDVQPLASAAPLPSSTSPDPPPA